MTDDTADLDELEEDLKTWGLDDPDPTAPPPAETQTDPAEVDWRPSLGTYAELLSFVERTEKLVHKIPPAATHWPPITEA